jgi:hypothetical protein
MSDVGEWEDLPDWGHEAVQAEGGWSAADWQDWELLRKQLVRLGVDVEPASGDRPVRHLMAYRGGRWLAGVAVEDAEVGSPLLEALKTLIARVQRLDDSR